MSRSILMAFLALVACRGGSSRPHDSATAAIPAVDHGSVGSAGSDGSAAPVATKTRKVVAVDGEVTVRGKVLVVGDIVHGDDVIETGAHGHVVVLDPIDDSHWELGPNQHATVGDATAWKVPVDAGTAPADAAASLDAAAPAKKAPVPPPPPPEKDDSAGASSGINGSTVGAAKAASDAAGDLVERQEGKLRRCLPAGAHVQIHVRVSDAGKVTTTVDGATGEAATCIKGVIANVKLAPAKANVNMMIENSSH